MSATLGEKLKWFRKRKGLSQLQLETEINAAPGSISRIENNTTNPTKETLAHIAEALDITTLEMKYVSGPHAEPATEKEIKEAQAAVKDFMETPGRLAYMIDERERMWAVSDTFKELTGAKESDYLGLPLTCLVLDEHSAARRVIDDNYLQDLLRNLLARVNAEMNFMIGDESYEMILEAVNSNPLAKNIWYEINKYKIHFASTEERQVALKFGERIPLNIFLN